MRFLKGQNYGNIILLVATLLLSCSGGADKSMDLEDPTDIYTIIKEDSTSGIDIVSAEGSDPIEVRKQIAAFEIPEQTYEKKRAMLYSLLDRLYELGDSSGGKISYLIDSLNYMTVHYLQNILLDKKSLTHPLQHKMLKSVASFDKIIRVYSWKDNLGVDLHLMLNVIQYQCQDSGLRTLFMSEIADNEDVDFACSRVQSIYKLKSEASNSLYLFNFMGNRGGKKNFKGSTIVEIVDDYLEFDYKAFEGIDEYYVLKYAEGEDVTVSFSPKTDILQYVFKNSEWTQKIRFVFDGQTFRKEKTE